MSKYRKKPVVIEAWKFDSFQFPDWMAGSHGHDPYSEFTDGPQLQADGEAILIQTLEGTMTANRGDWIIKGVKGELYPCKPDIFEATYEAVP